MPWVALQTNLNRLTAYVRSKHLTLNTAKSEVIHSNSELGELPIFRVACGKQCSDLIRRIRVTFNWTLHTIASFERAASLTHTYSSLL